MCPALRVPEISDATRREFLSLLAAAGLLTGCTGEKDPAPAGTPGTRTVDTPRGPVSVPTDPRRVLAVYTHDLANALVLGLSVVAGPGENGQPGSAFPPYLVEAFPEQSRTITRIAHRPEPDIEEIAGQRPDVILSGIFGSDTADPFLDRFDAIAPTVTYFYSEGEQYAVVPWASVLRQNAAAFGRESVAEEFIRGIEGRVAALRDRLAARWAGATYAVVEPYADNFYLYGPTAGHVPVTLGGLGLAPAGSVETLLAEAGPLGQGGATVSYERLGALDADVVFVPVSVNPDGTADRAGPTALTTKPLWSSVPAVAAGQVHEFTGDIFYESGPMAAAFVDVVERALGV